MNLLSPEKRLLRVSNTSNSNKIVETFFLDRLFKIDAFGNGKQEYILKSSVICVCDFYYFLVALVIFSSGLMYCYQIKFFQKFEIFLNFSLKTLILDWLFRLNRPNLVNCRVFLKNIFLSLSMTILWSQSEWISWFQTKQAPNQKMNRVLLYQ